jgi:predicted nuclease of predicted toxin-antitoxin system
MPVLLDEDLPHRLRFLLREQDVVTVRYAGWMGLKNGMLLRTAEEAGYQVFVTGDQKLAGQQNMNGRKLAVVVLTAQKMEDLRPHLQEIEDAIRLGAPGTLQVVQCGKLSSGS